MRIMTKADAPTEIPISASSDKPESDGSVVVTDTTMPVMSTPFWVMTNPEAEFVNNLSCNIIK